MRQQNNLEPTQPAPEQHRPDVILCVDGHMPSLADKRMLQIDLEHLNQPQQWQQMNAYAHAYLQQANKDYEPDAGAEYLWRALLMRSYEQAPWSEPSLEAPQKVSLAKSTNETVRRATRLLAMVNELHKAGYQRLRFIPYIDEDGVWCCTLTNAANIPHDYVERTGQVADLLDASYAKHYKATEGANYFGWTDSASMSARKLAAAFIQRFPDLAGRSQGQDWLYAGWLTSILGIAESGRMPVLFGPRNELVAVVPVPPPSFA